MTTPSRLLLALIVLVGLGRGLFWVVTIAVWNPIDEMQHFGYVSALAHGEGVPVVGEDVLPDEALLLAKDSATYGFRSAPVAPTADPSWGASAQQYEGVQPPLYYALLVPVYLLVRPQGLLATVVALRAATLLLSLIAVPLTALLARELFPTRRMVWIGAPALLVTLGAVNAYGAYITNDALVLPLSAAVLLVAARAWRRGPSMPQAAVLGVLGGLAFLARSSMVVLAPLVLLALAGAAVRHRVRPARVAAWATVAGGIASLIGLPWVAWTRLAYPGTSMVEQFSAIIGPIVGVQPTSLAGLAERWADATRGWFDWEVLRPPFGAYFWAAFAVCTVALVVGVAAAWRRRDGVAAASLVWLALSAPAGLVGMFLVIQLALHGTGGMVGRYLALTLPPLAVLVAAGLATALGDHWGAVVVALLVAVSLTGGARLDRRYVDFVYTQQAGDGVAPVVDQSWHDAWAEVATVAVAPPCPVRAVTLTFQRPTPPASLLVGGEPAPLAETATLFGNAASATYSPATPLAARFDVELPPGTAIGVAAGERAAALSLAGAEGDPVARLDCAVADPDATRFAQLYALADALPFIRFGTLMAVPLGWAILGWLALALTCGYQLRVWSIRHPGVGDPPHMERRSTGGGGRARRVVMEQRPDR